jgi:hypothetical protein
MGITFETPEGTIEELAPPTRCTCCSHQLGRYFTAINGIQITEAINYPLCVTCHADSGAGLSEDGWSLFVIDPTSFDLVW